MPVGVCKDRLADAFATYGRVPIVKRTVAVGARHPALRRAEEGPRWSAAGLIHDGGGRVLLVRHAPSSTWGDLWVTPGGWLEEGETTTDGLRREVREEVGLEILEIFLTRILNETLTHGDRVAHVYVAQFVAMAARATPVVGPGVLEAKWFDALPDEMAYRDDYVQDFGRVRAQRF